MSLYFAFGLSMSCELLDILVYAPTPIGDAIMVDRAYQSCLVSIHRCDTTIDLLLLDTVDFEVIIYVDWL